MNTTKIRIGLAAVLLAGSLAACSSSPARRDPAPSPSPTPSPTWTPPMRPDQGGPTPKPTQTVSNKSAAVQGCLVAIAHHLHVPAASLSFDVPKVSKTVGGSAHQYTVVGFVNGKSAICDGIEVVKGKVVPQKHLPLISVSGS